MTRLIATVFYVWQYGRLIEIQSNLRRKKLHITNQGSDFLGGSFSNIMQQPQSNLEEKVNPGILKDYFFSRTNTFIFTLIKPELIDRSNKTSWLFPALKSKIHFQVQSTFFHRSDLSSEANSSCCQRSDAWYLHSSDAPFLKGEVNFDYLPRRGDLENF